MAGTFSDLGGVLRTALRLARYAGYFVTVLLVLWVVDRLVWVHGLGAAVHPALGWLALALALVLLVVLVGRPVVRFARVPVAVRPPAFAPDRPRTTADALRHAHYLGRYLEALGRNPEWEGSRERLEAARASVADLVAAARRAGPADAASLSARIAAIEHGGIEPLLAPLDRKASDAIRAEAMAVGAATAVSPNGTLDAFLVLWRNVSLVARLATIYYGRPGVRGTLRVVSEVSATTLVSAYAQGASEIAGGMVGSFAGKAVGVIAGPILDGSLNAIGTLRIGYIARARCRSFSTWAPKSRREVAQEALAEAGRLAAGLVTDLVTQVGGGLLRLPVKIVAGIVSAVGSLFRKHEPQPELGAGEA